ncbi:glycosyltransferase family 2 protein [Fredinandcohnia humi]
MELEISIIVPVYNLEHLLQKCIDSILSQTFTNFELILVNDGSTDNSGKLCDEFAKHDSRVKVIHKENGGTASCRNVGIKAAKGRYIGFVDNDDYINKYMFEILYNTAIKHSSDIVVCNFRKVDEDSQTNLEELSSDIRIQHLTRIESLNKLYTDDFLTFICPWNKLYNKYLFEDIEYELGNINDDETVAHKLLYKSKKTTYLNAELYYYVQRKGSQIHSAFHVKRLCKVYALKDREIFFKNINETELHQKALKQYMEKFFWYYYLAKSRLNDVEDELKKLKHTFDHSLIDLLKHPEISWKQKVMCVLFSINPNLYEFIRQKSINVNQKQHLN